jgi:hypothetical protein
MRKNQDDELLVEVVKDQFHGHLFHTTDAAHLPSIEEHGLLSCRAARELGVVPAYPGGSELTRALDARRGVDDMVFLSFFNLGKMPDHDDARFRRPVTLKVAAEVLYMRGVKVALGPANSSRTMIAGPSRAYRQMDWEVIFEDHSRIPVTERWRIVNAMNYEVLVPSRVPMEYILGIA